MLIRSSLADRQVDVLGFEHADACLHMLEWLRRGPDVRRFLVADLEADLHAQDPGSALLSVECTSAPTLETKARTSGAGDTQAVVSAFSVAFPLDVRVRSGAGVAWRLDVLYGYRARGLDEADGFKLAADFTVRSARPE